jgi:medium-chain acyl-[acyl-carrier-protein] hydrolase
VNRAEVLDIVTFAHSRNPRARLVCFPCSGGTPTEYRSWSELGRHGIEVSAVRLPGREMRLREAPFRSLPRLITALVPYFREDSGCATVFFGHSMGALVAFELARALRALRLPGNPVALLVAARIAPHMQPNTSKLHLLPDDELLECIRRYNGSPASALASPSLMKLVLPTVRADFELVEMYRYVEQPKLDIPITIFGGLGDRFTPQPELEAWSELTRADCSVTYLPGDHFFHRESREPLLSIIAAQLIARGHAVPAELGGGEHSVSTDNASSFRETSMMS